MVQYLTKTDLRSQAGPINEQATILRKAADRSPASATFLSHSSKDEDLLPGVVTLLERHGAAVYIDKKDEALPPFTSSETADLLRGRIQQCKKFILLTTKNSKDSRWVPWELGLADGHKRPSNVAILPGTDGATDLAWTEQEYLGCYNRIVYGKIQNRPEACFMVYNHRTKTATELREWLGS
jgi:hypothetical protein